MYLYVGFLLSIILLVLPTAWWASAEELRKSWQSIIVASNEADKKTRGFEPGSGWLPRPIGYTLIAACEPQESAHETAFDAGSERNGALTYFLFS